MASNFVFLIFVLSSFIAAQVAAQYGCRPNIVINVELRDDILTWDDWEDEPCTISYYIVDILNRRDGTEYTFQVSDRVLDLTSLPPCQRYQFLITQISTDNLEGSTRLYFGTTAPPPEVDLTIQYIRLTPNPTWIVLEWALLDEWKYCASHYRLLTYNEDQDIPEDIYVSDAGISLTYLMPCTSYTFAITAMYNIEQQGPPSVVRHQMVAYETTAPVLLRVIPRSTSIEMTWSLDHYIRNRCPITSVNVNAAPYFSISFPIQDDPDNRPPFIINVPGLTPDTMYYFNVSITNTAGVSPGSIVYVQTLDRD